MNLPPAAFWEHGIIEGWIVSVLDVGENASPAQRLYQRVVCPAVCVVESV